MDKKVFNASFYKVVLYQKGINNFIKGKSKRQKFLLYPISQIWARYDPVFFVAITFQPKLYIGMCTNGIFLCHGEGGGGNFLYTTHYINITKNECMKICKGGIQTRYYLICFMYYERLKMSHWHIYRIQIYLTILLLGIFWRLKKNR